jgi:hypothetical protein
MKRAALLLLLALPAQAQPAAAPDKKVETVIVTGEKPPEEKAHDYIQTYTAPEPFLGKITRWHSKKYPICPKMVGFPQSYNDFVTARIREVAKLVGAPVNPKEDCRANVLIIVTSEPQSMLNDIRANHSNLLGYYSTPSAGDRLAKVNYPIQAWYMTATEDINGGVAPNTYYNPNCPDYCFFAVTGLRAKDGLINQLNFVTIVADANRIAGMHLGALADYFTMLALSQTDSFDACQELPSITSLMSPECPGSGLTEALSTIDLAYLKGVYEMDPGSSLTIQKSVIATEIRKALESR